MDQKSLETLARFKERLSRKSLEEKGLTLDTHDFSQAAKKAAKKRREQSGWPAQPPEVHDPKLSNKDAAIKVKKKVKPKKKNALGGGEPARTKKGDLKKRRDIHNPAIPTSPPSAAKKKVRGSWIKKHCNQCGAIFPVHIDWHSPPRYCKSCKESRKATFKGPKSKNSRTQYTFATIYQGGAPGGGKRR